MTTLLDTAPGGPSTPEPLGDEFTLDFPGMAPGAPYTVKVVLADVRAHDHRDTLFGVTANGETALRHGAIINSIDPADGLAKTSFVTSADDAGAIHVTFSSAFEKRQIRGIQILSGRHTPPPAPAFVRALAGTGRNEIRWDPVQSAVSYIVKRRGGDAHHMSPIASGLTECAYTDTMAAPDVAYSYQVIAVNAMGEGMPSRAADAIPAVGLEAEPAIAQMAGGQGSCLIAASIQPGVSGRLEFAIGGMRDGLQAMVEPASIEVSAADIAGGPLVTCLKFRAGASTPAGVQNVVVRARIDQYSVALTLPVRVG